MMFHYLQQAWRRREAKPGLPAEIEADRGFDYAELASRCRTQNEFNRLRIALENILTPAEIAGIAKLAVPAKSAERTQAWLDRLRKWQPNLFEAPQGYERRSTSRRFSFYQQPGGELRDKCLLVAFAGNAGRMMMPVCVFLQFVDSRLWDVVVVKKPASGSHFRGVEGSADDFPGLVRHLETTFRPDAYRQAVTLGTSSGGFCALWAAALMGAMRGISAGGCPPRTLPNLMLGNRPAQATDFCMVYSESAPFDHDAALALRGLFGGRLRPVADVEGHSVLGQLMKRGRFAEFLGEMLG
jgi:hypothetical protein